MQFWDHSSQTLKHIYLCIIFLNTPRSLKRAVNTQSKLSMKSITGRGRLLIDFSASRWILFKMFLSGWIRRLFWGEVYFRKLAAMHNRFSLTKQNGEREKNSSPRDTLFAF